MSYGQQARHLASEVGKESEQAVRDMGHKITAATTATTQQQEKGAEKEKVKTTGTIPVPIVRDGPSTARTGVAAAEAGQTAAEDQQSTKQIQQPQAAQAQSFITKTKEQVKQAVPERFKSGVGQASQYAQQSFEGGKGFAQRHPYLLSVPLLMYAMLLGMLVSSVPLALFGISTTHQPLISRLFHGPYDYYSYPKGSTESHSHAMLDQAIKHYREQERQSRLSRLLSSLGLEGKEFGKSSYEQERHLLPEPLYELLSGLHKPRSEESETSELLSKLLKGGVIGKTATSAVEKAPSLTSWFGGKKTPAAPEEESRASMLSSLFDGGKAKQQPQPEEHGWLSGLSEKLSIGHQSMPPTGLTKSEEQQLKRLISEAAQKQHRAL